MTRLGTKIAATMMCVALGVAGCGKSDEETPAVDLATVSPAIEWQDGPAGLHQPMSAAGPHEADPVPHGFDDNVHGAVLAAMTAEVWMAGAGEDEWPLVSQELLEPGVGRDQWAQARSLVEVAGTVTDAPEFVGFKIGEDRTDTSVVVVLATRWPTGELTAYPVQMSQASGEWKAVLPPQGEEPDLMPIDDLSGFVEFKGGEEQ